MVQVRRTSILVALIAALLCLAAGPAAATTFDDVGAALRSDPLYVDPKSEVTLSAGEQQQVRDAIADAGTPIYIALLPKAALTYAGGDPNAVLDRMRSAVGRAGTYAVMIGTSNSTYGFQGRSTLGSVGDLANAAYVDNRGNPTATLVQFSEDVGSRAAQGGLSGAASSASQGPSGASMLALAGVAGLAVAGVGGAVVYSRRKMRKQVAAQTEAVRKTLDEDITAFGEALDKLDVDLDDPRLGEEGREDLRQGIEQYDKAKKAARDMVRPEEASLVTSALDEGRWRLACVNARLAGEPLPEHRPPCFFDPRHGLSVKDVPFTPTSGVTREVPACQACAVAIESGAAPNARMVETSTGARPYWDSGREYAGYTSGYYRSNSDLFSTIFMATMIGNMMSSHTVVNYGDPGYGSYNGGGMDTWGSGGGGGGGGGWFDSGGGGGWGGGGGGDFGGGGGW